MADGRPPGAAAKAAVGQERHLLVQAHAGDGRGGGEHFPHARAGFGTFVAHHDNLSGFDAAAQDGFGGRFFRVEHPGGALVHQHLRGHP